MVKELRRDLYTQAAWAKKIGESRQVVNQRIKAGSISTLIINGAVLVKV